MDRLTVEIARINLPAAQRIIAAAVEHAERIGAPENIAVVDESGNLVAFARMDDAKFLSIDIAINKAITAAGARKSTHQLGPVTIPGQPAFGIQTQRGGTFTTIPGGLPLMLDRRVIGGIGVSSAAAAQDLEVAEAAVAAFGQMVASGPD